MVVYSYIPLVSLVPLIPLTNRVYYVYRLAGCSASSADAPVRSGAWMLYRANGALGLLVLYRSLGDG